MPWRNTPQRYGWLTVIFHWLTAAVIVGLFALGLWMVELDYYSRWYHTAPDIHKATGMLLFGLLVARIAWRMASPPPPLPAHHSAVQRAAASAVHHMLYLLLAFVMVSGYLIATAEGDPVSVFGWFDVPALVSGDGLEDTAGTIHEWLAWSLVGLAGLHALAALKHQFIDRDGTLKRIFGLPAHPEKEE